MTIPDLGWLGDLIAQHLYDENDTPFPQRRGWRIIVDDSITIPTIVDNPTKGTLDITLPHGGGGGGTVAPTPDTVAERDTAGELYATAFKGNATGSTAIAATGATADITLDAGRDVDIIAATSVGLGVTSGGGAKLSLEGYAIAFGDEDEPAALIITPNGLSGTPTIASAQALAIGAAGAMSVQPAQATAGVGAALTIGGGAGQTPGTHLAGNTDVQLGAVVGNATAKHRWLSGGGASIGELNLTATGMIFGSNAGTALQIQSGSSAILSAASLMQLTTSAQLYLNANEIIRRNSASSTIYGQESIASATIASATTTNIATFATTSNRVYQVLGLLTVSNDTDDQGASYWVRAAFKNVAGVVTQIGTQQAVAADLEDAGQTGLSAVLDFTGTTIRLRLTTDAADTVNVNGVLTVYERILA